MTATMLMRGARDIAREAADWVRVERPVGRVDVQSTKSSPTDVVTALDEGCEALIRRRLAEWRPEDGFIGEEGADVPSASGIEWIVDPIDGTVNFVYGLPAYAISIAARLGADIIVGYVHNIATGEEFGAIKGEGAWLWQGEERIALTGPPPVPLAEMLVATGFNYVAEMRAQQGAAVARLLPHIRDIRRIGSAALDLAALAAGRLDGYVEQGLKPWDLAAGGLLVTEAGLELAGLAGQADERLTMAARPDVAREYFDLVRHCGF